jgi:peptidoglycan/xylan/chitin deacetylase (PgdA/CDA1 family)
MSDFRKSKNDKKYRFQVLLAIEAAVIILIVIAYLFFTNYLKNKDKEPNTPSGTKTEQTQGNDGKDNNSNQGNEGDGDTTKEATPTPDPEKELADKIDALLKESDTLAKGYDYDKAIEKVESFEGDYTNYDKLTKAVEGYKAEKANLVPLGAYESVSEISHIFFHTLAADTKLAFDGDYDSNGYNYYMTTISEFNEMMKQMYDAGYVLVSIHDVAKKVTKEDGKVVYEAGDIMLPPDKKPFVISQDDVNYYEYMTGDGFAARIVIDENGDPKNEMILEDGTVSVGDYDMVPIIDTFVKEHPDFSYKGARGIIALTGYEGTLGYRTNDEKSPTYEADKKAVKKVVEVMKEKGWEFASHSYGHRDMGKATYKFTIQDSDRWMKEVGSLVGPTDLYIFPFGIDIETTMGHYESDKFNYLKKLGFDYFCGVFKDPWIQVQNDYVRMTRRPLDGQAMLQFPERLKDLFDLSKVIDPARPALK